MDEECKEDSGRVKAERERKRERERWGQTQRQRHRRREGERKRQNKPEHILILGNQYRTLEVNTREKKPTNLGHRPQITV